MYVAACGPARDENANYVAWGHSTIVDPKGNVVSTCQEKETIIYADIGKLLTIHTQRESWHFFFRC